ncbi:hypothetical protein AB9M92_11680 [Peribacillus frigoritolerans]|uniref:hypothetical protein n=1 Tax=Peribacillus frigoritolerans TaxID=450367 RepID=UPI0035194D30
MNAFKEIIQKLIAFGEYVSGNNQFSISTIRYSLFNEWSRIVQVQLLEVSRF